MIILSRFYDFLSFSDCQVGFKPKRLSDMFAMILKKCLPYYASISLLYYCAFLDATRAFDRKRSGGLPPVLFCLYFNDLIKSLAKLRIGCFLVIFLLQCWAVFSYYFKYIFQTYFEIIFKILGSICI